MSCCSPRLIRIRALVGSRSVTIRTEGVTLGVGGGLTYQLYRSWLLGANLRYSMWLLPEEPETDAFGDEASLVGRSSVIMVSGTVGYRLTL